MSYPFLAETFEYEDAASALMGPATTPPTAVATVDEGLAEIDATATSVGSGTKIYDMGPDCGSEPPPGGHDPREIRRGHCPKYRSLTAPVVRLKRMASGWVRPTQPRLSCVLRRRRTRIAVSCAARRPQAR